MSDFYKKIKDLTHHVKSEKRMTNRDLSLELSYGDEVVSPQTITNFLKNGVVPRREVFGRILLWLEKNGHSLIVPEFKGR